MSGFCKRFKGFFSKRQTHKDSERIISEIGLPTNIVHDIHVSKNPMTGDLEGLPKSWIRIMDREITKDERRKNPFAFYQATRCCNYSIKKKDSRRQSVIDEECEDIDRHKSQECTTSEDSYSEAEALPSLSQKKAMIPPLKPKRNFRK